MPYLVHEKKALLALCFIGLGIWVLTQIKLLAAPVRISEKAIGLLLLAIILLGMGAVQIIRALRRIGA